MRHSGLCDLTGCITHFASFLIIFTSSKLLGGWSGMLGSWKPQSDSSPYRVVQGTQPVPRFSKASDISSNFSRIPTFRSSVASSPPQSLKKGNTPLSVVNVNATWEPRSPVHEKPRRKASASTPAGSTRSVHTAAADTPPRQHQRTTPHSASPDLGRLVANLRLQVRELQMKNTRLEEEVYVARHRPRTSEPSFARTSTLESSTRAELTASARREAHLLDTVQGLQQRLAREEHERLNQQRRMARLQRACDTLLLQPSLAPGEWTEVLNDMLGDGQHVACDTEEEDEDDSDRSRSHTTFSPECRSSSVDTKRPPTHSIGLQCFGVRDSSTSPVRSSSAQTAAPSLLWQPEPSSSHLPSNSPHDSPPSPSPSRTGVCLFPPKTATATATDAAGALLRTGLGKADPNHTSTNSYMPHSHLSFSPLPRPMPSSTTSKPAVWKPLPPSVLYDWRTGGGERESSRSQGREGSSPCKAMPVERSLQHDYGVSPKFIEEDDTPWKERQNQFLSPPSAAEHTFLP